ncbi:hypothetical protein DY000_02033390 [Brassica cretica]|uniref:Serine-threonine/tyrosine-protein kinase catalytic domain-containing protein n=1 Tax=Brassica cretica TaxID=69181 RepID=A0ABQ7DJC7_BRACR|nr:hypothetical protein DY000_02033390 [Brassica cretica]
MKLASVSILCASKQPVPGPPSFLDTFQARHIFNEMSAFEIMQERRNVVSWTAKGRLLSETQNNGIDVARNLFEVMSEKD